MEFPDLGRNCAFRTCNRLDFLPYKCGACQQFFCADHFVYVNHECPAPNKSDVQVPECPLCRAPVPGRRGEDPDVAVGEHIENQCQSDPAKKRRKKVFTNRCAYKGCKTKEMMEIICYDCDLNYCLKHRHPADHACEEAIRSIEDISLGGGVVAIMRSLARRVRDIIHKLRPSHRPQHPYSSDASYSGTQISAQSFIAIVLCIIIPLYILAFLTYQFNREKYFRIKRSGDTDV